MGLFPRPQKNLMDKLKRQLTTFVLSSTTKFKYKWTKKSTESASITNSNYLSPLESEGIYLFNI